MYNILIPNIMFILILFFTGCDTKSKNNKSFQPEIIQDINLTNYPQTLILKIGKRRLNIDMNTTIRVYTKENKDITDKVEWIIKPKEAVKIEKRRLIAKEDVNVTIMARYKNEISNKERVEIYWEVDGHRVPPKPDPKKNNSTLLGVDVNKNGVRDDVERWIYKKYSKYYPCRQELDYNNTAIIDGEVIPSAKIICEKKAVPYHPAVRAAMMDVARAAQIIIKDPKKAKETDVIFTKAYACAMVIEELKDNKGRKLVQDNINWKEFEEVQFNTVKRARAYAKFNYYLSGGVYMVPPEKYILKNWCSPKVKELIKGLRE